MLAFWSVSITFFLTKSIVFTQLSFILSKKPNFPSSFSHLFSFSHLIHLFTKSIVFTQLSIFFISSDSVGTSDCLFKGELQRQNELISSKRPFKILQNETKIVKIRQLVFEIFNFKDPDLDSFPRKND